MRSGDRVELLAVVDDEDDLDHDQQDDVPLDTQALARFQQVHVGLGRVRDELELAGKSAVAVAQLVFAAQAFVETIEVGAVPGDLGFLADLHASHGLSLGDEDVADPSQHVAPGSRTPGACAWPRRSARTGSSTNG